MKVTRDVEVEIEVELDEFDTKDLWDEITGRDDYENTVPPWETLYEHLATGRDADALQILREFVQINTGRVLP